MVGSTRKCCVGHDPIEVLRTLLPWYMATLTSPTYGGKDCTASLCPSDTNHNVRLSTDCECSSALDVDYTESLVADLKCHRDIAHGPTCCLPKTR